MLAQRRFRALVLDYDGTICDREHRYGVPPAEIVSPLEGLLAKLEAKKSKAAVQPPEPLLPKLPILQAVTGLDEATSVASVRELIGAQLVVAKPDRVEHGVHAHVDRPQGAQREPPNADPGRPDEARFETAMAAEPDELSRVRSLAQ